MPLRDTLEITVQGGKGGDGGMSFLRLKYMPKGGPDGGHGGHGGGVWLETVEDVASLERLVSRRHYKGETGAQGEGRNKAGKQGVDLTLQVPAGTLVLDADTGERLADLLNVGERALVAPGGVGGRGNASFASSLRRTPRFAEYGTPGVKRKLRLELRIIADVGLVGYPNAGKSSLLAALSNAKPQIAAYPFTTLSPNLGVVERDLERFTLADIPGLIEGASEGKGLGLEFLRHISRTRLLVYVLDIAEDPAANLEALRHELNAYDPSLLTLPALIALNKTDVADEEDVADATAELTRFGLPVLGISALERSGIDDIRNAVFDLLPARTELTPLETAPTRITVEPVVVRALEDGIWEVTGSEIMAVVSRFDAKNREAVAYLQHHFTSLGVYKLLKRAGAKAGDDVYIGEAVFEYFDDAKGAAAETEADAPETDFDEANFNDAELNDTDTDDADMDDSDVDGSGLEDQNAYNSDTSR